MKRVELGNIKDFGGQDVQTPEGQPFTTLEGLKTCLWRFGAQSPEEARLAKYVGEILHACDGPSVALEDAECALLAKAVKANVPQYTGAVWAQLLDAVDGAKLAEPG